MTRLFQARSSRRTGSLLVEVSVAMGLATMLALVLMRASMISISSNQWTIMQTLTDAYLTRETALANRTAFADVIASGSAWPNQALDIPPVSEQTVTLGKLPGGKAVTGVLKRCRVAETPQGSAMPLAIWRLHSVLVYQVGDEVYSKSRSVLRVQ